MVGDIQDAALRLDKWLWYARFFKTRSAATKAIQGGRFRLDGEIMSKPHRQAICGQVLTFVQGSHVRVIRILTLGSRRGPAPEAALLYEDLAPITPRDTAAGSPGKFGFETRGKGEGRPTKRQRRQTDRLKGDFIDSED